MLVYLKDVEFSEVSPIIEKKFPNHAVKTIVKDTAFVNNRNALFKNLKSYKSEMIVMAIYDFKYLKWSYVYFLAVYLGATKAAYIIDKNGLYQKLNLVHMCKITILSSISLLKQIWDALTYSVRLSKKRFNLLRSANKNNSFTIAYVRTTDTFNLKAGGSLGHTVGIIDGFKEHGANIHFLAIDDIEQVKVDKKKIIPPAIFYNYINIFNRYNYNARFVKACSSIFNNNHFDFIYQRASRDNFSGTYLSSKYQIPLVLEFNSFLSWELSGASHGVHKLFIKPTIEIEKLNLEQADLITTVSDVLKEQLIGYGVNSNKVLVCPNAVDSSTFYPNIEGAKILKEKLGIPLGIKVAGFSGTFGFWHGIDILVKSLSNLAKKRPEHYYLLIGDGPYRQSAEEQLKEFSNVIFTGSVPYTSINEYLSVCDILLSPHNIPAGEKFIGSPTKLFEYMACRKVIIASDLDQIGEVVSPSIKIASSDDGFSISKRQGNEVGITVKPGSVEQLSFAIEYAFENLESLSELGFNAREKACKKHSWSTVCGSIITKLDELLLRKS